MQAVQRAALSGTCGRVTFAALPGAQDYARNHATSIAQAHTSAHPIHDTLTVHSVDGTATQIIDVTINGTNDGATISGTAAGAVTEDEIGRASCRESV